MSKPLTYADAGVDIDKAKNLIGAIEKIAKKTRSSAVVGEIGGFGGLFSLNVTNYDRPVLVSSTDGVGTKLNLAFMMHKHDTVGIDLVAMCVNDIAAQGAKPLFFLDYISIGKLEKNIVTEIVAGIGQGCQMAKCALIGGETAEMPGIYKKNEYDLAGFSVGIVDYNNIVDGSEIHVGNVLIGIASSGLHSNGYSMVRKICFDILKLKPETHIPEFGHALGEELLTPTRIYSQTILQIIRDLPVHGLAHITGGGIVDNLIRILPKTSKIVLRNNSWDVPAVFPFLQKAGKVTHAEMMRTFNNGIGLVAVVPEKHAQDIYERLNGMNERAFFIGEVVENKKSRSRITWA